MRVRGKRILFALHRHRGCDPAGRPSPWLVDLPSVLLRRYPGQTGVHFFDDAVLAGRNVDSDLLEACENRKPEALIYIPVQSDAAAETQPSLEALMEISQRLGVVVIAYLGDAWLADEERERQAREWSRCCDRLLIAEPRSRWLDRDWARSRLLLLWFGRDPEIFRPRGMARDIALGFTGSSEQYPERREALDRLRRAGLPVVEKGGVSVGNFTTFEDIAEQFSRTYISLNFTSIPTLPGARPIRGRVWESIRSGCLLFEEAGSSTELFFRPGEHYVAFDGHDDLREKAEYYLERRGEGERIARAGYEEARQRYGTEVLLQRLFGCVEQCRKEKATVA